MSNEDAATDAKRGRVDYARLRALVERGAAKNPVRFYANGKMSWGTIGTETKGSRNRLESIRYGRGVPSVETLLALADLFGDDPQEWLEAGGVIAPQPASEPADSYEARFRRLRRALTAGQVDALLDLMERLGTGTQTGEAPPAPPQAEQPR